MTTKVQIIANSSEDALMLAKAGTDLVGLAPHNAPNLPSNGLTAARLRELFESMPAGAMGVALTFSTEVDEIAELARVSGADAVQIIGRSDDVPPEAFAQLRAAVPTCKWIRAIGMWDRSAIDVALRFQHVADYLLLDSRAPTGAGQGASGLTHDWSISAEIVRRVHIPVILAGGISADNVVAAIRTVHPWGVDSYTLTNIAGTRKKDPEKGRLLLERAHNALED